MKTENKVSLEQVLWSREKRVATQKELLEKYGAQQLKQVNPADYAAILKEAEVIGNA